MKIERGHFRVVRACCTSGNCVTCLASFNKAKRKWFVHMDRLSKETAEQIAANYRAYDARVEPEQAAE